VFIILAGKVEGICISYEAAVDGAEDVGAYKDSEGVNTIFCPVGVLLKDNVFVNIFGIFIYF